MCRLNCLPLAFTVNKENLVNGKHDVGDVLPLRPVNVNVIQHVKILSMPISTKQKHIYYCTSNHDQNSKLNNGIYIYIYI